MFHAVLSHVMFQIITFEDENLIHVACIFVFVFFFVLSPSDVLFQC
jgi:hypothetical protein